MLVPAFVLVSIPNVPVKAGELTKPPMRPLSKPIKRKPRQVSVVTVARSALPSRWMLENMVSAIVSVRKDWSGAMDAVDVVLAAVYISSRPIPAAMDLGPHLPIHATPDATIFQLIECTAPWKNLIDGSGLLGF
jgi:hypothetical protein